MRHGLLHAGMLQAGRNGDGWKQVFSDTVTNKESIEAIATGANKSISFPGS